MVNLSSDPSVDYSEDQCPGEHLHHGIFYDGNAKFCLISGTDLLSFDSENGQRLAIRRHSDRVVGVHFHQGMLLSLTDVPEVYVWEVKSEKLLSRRKIEMPQGYRIGWSYQSSDGAICLLATNCEETEERAEDSLLLKFTLNALTNEFTQRNSAVGGGDRPPIVSRCVALTGKRPKTKRHLDIGKDFYVKCQGKRLTMAKFNDISDDAKHGKKGDTEKTLSNCEQFVLNSHFQVEDQRLVEFDSVKISDDSLFATLNVGRIYCWSKVETCGFSASKSSHVTLTGHRVVAEFTAHGTMFVGTGNGLLLKYNIAAASGAGRWHKLEQLSLECPIRSMVLSADFALLVLIHSDNSVCIVRSAGLCITHKAETVKKPTVNAVGIVHDPLNSGCIFTNSKIGSLQWIDPLQWKTISEVDISEENVPPEDTFNRPDFLWLDVSLVCLSIPRIVTCEQRRNELEKTFLKFWRRSSADPGQLQMENCVVVPRRISFVRSTLDQFWDCSALTVPMTNGQEFLVIYSNGEMEVYIQSENRGSLWHCDLKRHYQNWHQFVVKHCSAIASTNGRFATVNSLADNSRVFLWHLATLSIVKMIDTLVNPSQVGWATPSVLLIACQFGVVSFDSDANTFPWAIHHPNLSIASNHLATFAYDGHFVFVINALNGTLKSDPLRFSERQKEVVAVGERGNVLFVGISEGGALSVLTPNSPQTIGHSAELPKQKGTAFSHLMAANGRTPKKSGEQSEERGGRTNHAVVLLEMPSIKQFIDGPAHSLPPIAQLTRQFLDVCLARRSDAN
ncbi:hypothetical protein niasHT_022538 [Heterodera trifolii]|uniref:WD repeat-containing protein 75 n=1 Tax=Heterodera trifolii TaxID=157864 RepID=A0ABD2JR68_9BILA